ncbi:MAG: hypothetical protein AABY27_04625 [Pseudomonadota bacterium]
MKSSYGREIKQNKRYLKEDEEPKLVKRVKIQKEEVSEELVNEHSNSFDSTTDESSLTSSSSNNSNNNEQSYDFPEEDYEDDFDFLSEEDNNNSSNNSNDYPAHLTFTPIKKFGINEDLLKTHQDYYNLNNNNNEQYYNTWDRMVFEDEDSTSSSSSSSSSQSSNDAVGELTDNQVSALTEYANNQLNIVPNSVFTLSSASRMNDLLILDSGAVQSFINEALDLVNQLEEIVGAVANSEEVNQYISALAGQVNSILDYIEL